MKTLISGDYNAFSEGYNGAGVYMASGISPSSAFERPIYIGGTNNLQRRISFEHIPNLWLGEHDNRPLQYYWLKNSGQCVWFLLEACPSINVFEKEQEWLDKLRPFADEFRGFNIAKLVEQPFLGKNHTEQAKKSIGDANRGRPKTIQELIKLRDSIRNSAAWGARKSRAKLKDPFGIIHDCVGIAEFAKKHELNKSCLTKLISKKRASHKGWRLSE